MDAVEVYFDLKYFILILALLGQAFGEAFDLTVKQMISKTKQDENARLTQMKFQEDQKILQRIRYLKTKCICRLFCTGLIINKFLAKNAIILGPRKACEEMMFLETKISTWSQLVKPLLCAQKCNSRLLLSEINRKSTDIFLDHKHRQIRNLNIRLNFEDFGFAFCVFINHVR